MQRTLFGAALAAALVGLAGCGGGGPKIVPASGVVTIDGQPLTYGHIQVLPTGWRPASSRIGGDGRFTLTTTVQGDGCAVGTHPVAILAGESITPEHTKWHAPQKYADIQTSNLTVTITGPTNDLKIELKSDGGKSIERKDREGGTESTGFKFDK
jgi:predicted small lipoprotein YifL